MGDGNFMAARLQFSNNLPVELRQHNIGLGQFL